MLKFISILCVGLLLFTPVLAGEKLPNNILSQIPNGFAVLAYKSGYLDDDKLKDYLVVVHDPKEEELYNDGKELSPRPLLIFTQQKDHSFNLAKRNNIVVYKGSDCGATTGYMTVEDSDLLIAKNLFAVTNSCMGGMNHLSRSYLFQYDALLHDWVLNKITYQSWTMNDGEPNHEALKTDGRKVVYKKHDPIVLFEQFNSEAKFQ